MRQSPSHNANMTMRIFVDTEFTDFIDLPSCSLRNSPLGNNKSAPDHQQRRCKHATSSAYSMLCDFSR